MKEMILAGQHTIYPLGLIHPFACCGAISTNCTASGGATLWQDRALPPAHLCPPTPLHRNVLLQLSATCTSMLHISVQRRKDRKLSSTNIHRQETLLQESSELPQHPPLLLPFPHTHIKRDRDLGATGTVQKCCPT